MLHSRLNQLLTFSVSILLILPIFIIGCGDEGDDENGMDIVKPDPSSPATPEPTIPQPPEPEPPPLVSFAKDIQPILRATCAVAGCHAGGAPTGGLNLETYDNFKKGGNSGAAFKPNNGKGSVIVGRIDGGGMPPGGPPLKQAQIDLFINWIDAGAENN